MLAGDVPHRAPTIIIVIRELKEIMIICITVYMMIMGIGLILPLY